MSQTVEGLIADLEASARRLRHAKELFPDVELVDGRLWSEQAKTKANSIEVCDRGIFPAYRENDLVVVAGLYGWMGPRTPAGLFDEVKKKRPDLYAAAIKFLLGEP